MLRRRKAFLFVWWFCLCCVVTTSAQQSGALDSSFGKNGKVITPIGTEYSEASDIVIQPDGKIIVVGLNAGGRKFTDNGSTRDFTVVRYNINGLLDQQCGKGGKVITTFDTFSDDYAQAVAIQADGKIVVVGYSTSYNADGNPIGDTNFAVVRYNLNGTLDTNFGDGGKIVTQIGTSSADFAYSVAIQPDDKIVVAGYSSFDGNTVISTARYDENGKLDRNFGNDGKVITPARESSSIKLTGSAVAIQTDGKIIVVGEGGVDSDRDFAVVRYNTNGSLDTSFSNDGIVITPIGNSFEYARAVAIQSDGKIVVAGASHNSTTSEDFAVVRYNPNGTLDNNFGRGGKITTPVQNSTDRALDIAIQLDNKIVVVGYSAGRSENDDIAVVTYNSDGSLDTSFGKGGKVLTAIGERNDSASAVAIQADNKIVVAGSSMITKQHFAVVRYTGNYALSQRVTDTEIIVDLATDVLFDFN